MKEQSGKPGSFWTWQGTTNASRFKVTHLDSKFRTRVNKHWTDPKNRFGTPGAANDHMKNRLEEIKLNPPAVPVIAEPEEAGVPIPEPVVVDDPLAGRSGLRSHKGKVADPVNVQVLPEPVAAAVVPEPAPVDAVVVPESAVANAPVVPEPAPVDAVVVPEPAVANAPVVPEQAPVNGPVHVDLAPALGHALNNMVGLEGAINKDAAAKAKRDEAQREAAADDMAQTLVDRMAAQREAVDGRKKNDWGDDDGNVQTTAPAAAPVIGKLDKSKFGNVANLLEGKARNPPTLAEKGLNLVMGAFNGLVGKSSMGALDNQESSADESPAGGAASSVAPQLAGPPPALPAPLPPPPPGSKQTPAETIARLTQQMFDLTRELGEERTQAAGNVCGLEEQIQALNASVAEKDLAIADLNKQIADADVAHATVVFNLNQQLLQSSPAPNFLGASGSEGEINLLRNQLKTAKADLAQEKILRERAIENAARDISRKDQEIKQLQENSDGIARAKRNVANARDDIADEVKDLRHELVLANQKNLDLQKQISSAAGGFNPFEQAGKLCAANAKVDRLQAELDQANKDLRDNVHLVDPELQRLQGLLDIANADVARLRGLVGQPSAEAARLQVDLNTANATVARVQGDLMTANNEVVRLRGIVAQLNTEAVRLQGLLDTANTVSAALQRDLDGATGKVGRLETDLDGWRRRATTASPDAVRLQAELDKANADLTRLRGELDAATQDGFTRTKTIPLVNPEVTRLQSELDQANGELVRLRITAQGSADSAGLIVQLRKQLDNYHAGSEKWREANANQCKHIEALELEISGLKKAARQTSSVTFAPSRAVSSVNTAPSRADSGGAATGTFSSVSTLAPTSSYMLDSVSANKYERLQARYKSLEGLYNDLLKKHGQYDGEVSVERVAAYEARMEAKGRARSGKY